MLDINGLTLALGLLLSVVVPYITQVIKIELGLGGTIAVIINYVVAISLAFVVVLTNGGFNGGSLLVAGNTIFVLSTIAYQALKQAQQL